MPVGVMARLMPDVFFIMVWNNKIEGVIRIPYTTNVYVVTLVTRVSNYKLQRSRLKLPRLTSIFYKAARPDITRTRMSLWNCVLPSRWVVDVDKWYEGCFSLSDRSDMFSPDCEVWNQ